MAFPGNNYAPPGVYTQTNFDNPLAGSVERLTIPAYIGEGSENLVQTNLEMVRGSSSSIDTHVVDEDQTGRAVVSVNAVTGSVSLGSFDGNRTKFQIRNNPVVNGDGTGTTTNDRSAVAVTMNGTAMLVLSLDGAKGIVELAQAPKAGDVVRCTYFFNRTDTVFTDTLNDQVTPGNAELFGSGGVNQIGGTYNVSAGVNDELLLTVPNQDGAVEVSVTLPSGDLTPQVMANTITAAVPNLTALPIVNNLGLVVIRLSSDFNIEVGQGTANTVLGFVGGTKTRRSTTFTTFMGPIVDGSGGGVTTTDPSKVTVIVNNQQVLASAVNGQLRQVTLPFAPSAGSSVVITYFQNTWQDTFDYLAHIGVTSITRCGLTPDRTDFIDGIDYILKDDTVIWGTSVLVSNVSSTSGAQVFGENQITATLVDQQEFMAICSPTLDTSVVPAITSSRVFKLTLAPTTGNGRNSPLGTSLFQQVTNNRIDLPTDRPDLVTAFWGFSLNDAVARGAVEVVEVESSTAEITLAEDVPVGATVFATFFYNTLVDKDYTLSVVQPGAGGVGTYTVSDTSGPLFVADTYTVGNRIPDTMVNLQTTPAFPSGSSLRPGIRFETSPTATFTGPVEEEVTITFAANDDSLAEFVFPSPGPYNFVDGASDSLDLTMNQTGTDQSLSDIFLQNNAAAGALTWLTGEKVTYTGNQGQEFTVDATNNVIDLTVGGVAVSAVVNPSATATVANYAASINAAADGEFVRCGPAVGGNAATDTVINLLPADVNDQDDFYVGWEAVVLFTGGANATADMTITNVAIDAVPTCDITITPDGGAPVVTNVPIAQNDTPDVVKGKILAAMAPVVGAGGPLEGVVTVADGGVGIVTVTAVASGLDGNNITILCDITDAQMTGAPNPAGPLALGSGVNQGQRRTITAYDATTGVATLDNAWDGAGGGVGNPPNNSRVWLSDPTSWPKLSGSTEIDSTLSVGLFGGDDFAHDQMTVRMSDRGGAPITASIALTAAAYNITALVTQINLQLNANPSLNGGPTGVNEAEFPRVEASGSVNGQVVFTFRRSPVRTGGDMGTAIDANAEGALFEFIEQGVDQDDLLTLLGYSSDGAGGAQPKVYHGPIAFRSTTTGSTPFINDRLMLCGRIYPGQGDYGPVAGSYPLMSAHHVLSQTGITVLPGSGNATVGLISGKVAETTNKAVIAPASLASVMPITGQLISAPPAPANDGEFSVVFFSGDDAANAANNVFSFTVDGVTVNMTFTATPDGLGTPTGLGTANDTPDPGSIIGQINAALVAHPGSPFGNLAAVQAAQIVRREGAGIRITSATPTISSSVVMGDGSANSLLGFIDGSSASRDTVSPDALASWLNTDAGDNAIPGLITYPDCLPAPAQGAQVAAGFRARGYAYVVTDDAGLEYFGVQSWVDLGAVAGTTSIILWGNSASNDAFRQGTGTGMPSSIVAGTTDPDAFSAQGDAGVEGYIVTSNNPVGSGSADTSILGTAGQDGTVGKTYHDDVTGLTFTIIPAVNAYDPAGSFRVKVTSTWTTDGAVPVHIPGCNVVVTDTWQTLAGNEAKVETFKRNTRDSSTGLTLGQPTVGDIYYISYIYTKQDMTPSLYTKFSSIEQSFGPLTPDNPLTLAAYLAMLNGAILVGCAQTKKETGSNFASEATYKAVVDALDRPMPGFVTADVLVPLKGDSTALYQYISRDVDVQSSIRYRQERTSIFGVASGTDTDAVGTLAKLISNTRMRVVYPDTATLTLTDALGTRREYIVDGPYLAAAMSGNRVSPTLDVASPWTGAQLVGFNLLGRQLDAVEQNQTAVNGITILVDQPPFLRVRQGFTTDMKNILTKTPTIIQIADEVQKNTRGMLQNFVGIKFLPGILSQIEGRVAMMLKGMVQSQIIAAYTGVRATVSADDPTVAEIEAFYQPIFPLLYLVVTFNLRSSLGT